MVAICRIVLAVTFVSAVTLVQIDARPAESSADWAAPIEAALKNITSKITEAVGDGTEYTNMAKNNFNSFVDSFKSELSVLSKTLDGKAGVSDLVKEATKQWQTAVDKYAKALPEDLSLPKLNEKFESSLKYITQTSNDLYKKAQGNSEIEKEIKDFTKKQIDALMEQVKSIQAKVVSDKKV